MLSKQKKYFILRLCFSSDLEMLDRVIYLSKAQRRKLVLCHLAPNRRKLVTTTTLSKLFSDPSGSCATSYRTSLVPYSKCAREWLQCVRRKRVLASIVWWFSHLKIYNCDREGSFVFQKSKWIAHFASRFRKYIFFCLFQVAQKKVSIENCIWNI